MFCSKCGASLLTVQCFAMFAEIKQIIQIMSFKASIQTIMLTISEYYVDTQQY